MKPLPTHFEVAVKRQQPQQPDVTQVVRNEYSVGNKTDRSQDGDQENGVQSIFGMLGLGMAMIGFAVAMATPWIKESAEPPQEKSFGEMAKDISMDLKQKVVAKLKGEPVSAATEEPQKVDTRKWLGLSTLCLGTGAVLLGIIGTTRREDWRMSGCSMILGIGAIVLQYFLMIVLSIVAIMIILVILGSLGISP